MSFNKIIIVGNLGRDPELRYTAQGTPVCNVSVASSTKRKDKNGEMQEYTTWFRLSLWNRLAENCSQYLSKGDQAYFEGELTVSEYIDRDGKDRHSLDVRVTDMKFVGNKLDDDGRAPARTSSRSAESYNQQQKSEPELTDDDIPF
jgi:single-strand DNA-binding protein